MNRMSGLLPQIKTLIPYVYVQSVIDWNSMIMGIMRYTAQGCGYFETPYSYLFLPNPPLLKGQNVNCYIFKKVILSAGGIFTSRFSGRGNRIGPVCLCVRLSALSWQNSLTYHCLIWDSKFLVCIWCLTVLLSISLKGLCVQRDYGLGTREVCQRRGLIMIIVPLFSLRVRC